MGITPEESILGDAIQMSDGAGALNVTYVRTGRERYLLHVQSRWGSKLFQDLRKDALSPYFDCTYINRVLDDWVS